jgi:predicted enzyme related to lactoylglutathione lyase
MKTHGNFCWNELMTPDVAATKVEPAGGGVLRGPWPVPGVGKIAIVLDAAGSSIGYMEAEPM